MSLSSAVPKSALSLLCAGLLLTAPTIAAPKPAAAPNAADSASAVAVVSKMLTLRAKNNFGKMYDLLSATSRAKISRMEFLGGAPHSKTEIAQMPPALRGQYALFADTQNTLGYTFAVVGPDPNNPAVVLVHAFPKPAPGVLPATLKIYTVTEAASNKMSRRTVNVLESITRAMRDAQSKMAPSPAAPPPVDTPPAAP